MHKLAQAVRSDSLSLGSSGWVSSAQDLRDAVLTNLIEVDIEGKNLPTSFRHYSNVRVRHLSALVGYDSE